MKRLSFSNKVPVGTVFAIRASWSDASSSSSVKGSVFFAEEFAGAGAPPPYAPAIYAAFRSRKACNAAKGQSDVTAAARGPASVWPRTNRPSSVISCSPDCRFLAPNRLLDFDSLSVLCSCGRVRRRNSNIISSVGSRSMRGEFFSSDGLRPCGVSTTVLRLSVSGVALTRGSALGSSCKTLSRSYAPSLKPRFFFGASLRDSGVSC